MHKVMDDQKLKQRLLNKKRQRGENLVNFAVGDYVLRSRIDEKKGSKLLVTWVGPYRVVRADPYSFCIQHLVTGAEMDVHASRLKFYADDSLEVNEELLEHISAQGIILAVEKLKAHRWNPDIDDYEILVQWKGLEEIEDSYEPLTSLAKDVSALVTAYIENADEQLKSYWRQVTLDKDHLVQPMASTIQPTLPETPVPRKSRRKSGRSVGKQPVRVQPVAESTKQDIGPNLLPDQTTESPSPVPVSLSGSKRGRSSDASTESQRVLPKQQLGAPFAGAEIRAAEEPVSRRTRSRSSDTKTPAIRRISLRKRQSKPDHE
ncbi:hypothetical protein PR003_g29016 [Phytophthora rubi]|uniref:Chromo domain-containing protein n=1 Tax=Phytophthora rubi TaxID=129364 RepID=A0A6A4BL47_9STRA|nr:hypothetical protein PR003_g29016 [Phytophthora rubi]